MRAIRKRKRPGAEEQLTLRILWPCRTPPFGTSRTGSTGPSPPPAGAVSFAIKEITPYGVGGSMSGAEGFRPGGPGSSTCNSRSAAFSNKAAETFRVFGCLGELKKDRRLTHEILSPDHRTFPVISQRKHPTRKPADLFQTESIKGGCSIGSPPPWFQREAFCFVVFKLGHWGSKQASACPLVLAELGRSQIQIGPLQRS